MSAPLPPLILEDTPFVRPTLTRLYWRHPVDTGSSPISSYTVTCSSISYTGSVPYPEQNITVTGLTDGVQYNFEIVATNTDGYTSVPAAYYPLETGAPPASPTSVSHTVVSSNAAIIQWTPPGYIGGSALTYNAIWVYPIDPQSNILSNLPTSTLREYANGYDTSNLVYIPDPTIPYKYIVRAVNSCDWSPDSSDLYQLLTFSSPSPSIDSNGLFIHFDATSYSGSGAWSNLATTGATYDASVAAGSASLNGSSNGIVLNGSTRWSFSNPNIGNTWTYSLWMKVTSYPGSNSFAPFLGVNGMGPNNTGKIGYHMGSNLIGAVFTGASILSSSNLNLNTSEWYNVTITWDYSSLTLMTYINGSNFSSNVAPSSNSSNYDSNAAYIMGGDSFAYVNGELGQVLIYNRALSAGEVGSNYTATSNIFA
jgi:hypothetical protein